MNRKERQEVKRLKRELQRTEAALQDIIKESAYFCEQWKFTMSQLLEKDVILNLNRKTIEMQGDAIANLTGAISRLAGVAK